MKNINSLMWADDIVLMSETKRRITEFFKQPEHLLPKMETRNKPQKN